MTMNLKENRWIWIKVLLLFASCVTTGLEDPGDPDWTSYPFVTTLPLLFGALFLPVFLRQCETTKRYTSRFDLWRAHPFLIGTGPFPFWHFGAWVMLSTGLVGLPVALLGARDLGTAFFSLSTGTGCLIGVHRTLKENRKNVDRDRDAPFGAPLPHH
jgi:hypothetical protein